MTKSSHQTTLDRPTFPSPAGYLEYKPTLCIGLDIAWFGGSQSNPSSQYDFLAAVLFGPGQNVEKVECRRLPLVDHDRDAGQTAAALKELIKTYTTKAERIVLAIDAPLQAASRGLPVRKPLPKKGAVLRRACEEHLSSKRMSIDIACGGAKNWHPIIQPGAPLAPRVESLLCKLNSVFEVWTVNRSEHPKLIIECFPAEAIWGAKRMDWFPQSIGASEAKAYKQQKRKWLIAAKVTQLIETVLVPFGKICSGSRWKDEIVEKVLEKILDERGAFRKSDGQYRGGKLLDAVVDSLLCLATAIGYTTGNAHVWQDLNHTDDGHIIGPGTMQELFNVTTVLSPNKK